MFTKWDNIICICIYSIMVAIILAGVVAVIITNM